MFLVCRTGVWLLRTVCVDVAHLEPLAIMSAQKNEHDCAQKTDQKSACPFDVSAFNQVCASVFDSVHLLLLVASDRAMLRHQRLAAH